MQIDLQSDPLPNADRMRPQVCIVGGGLAGLTLADALLRNGVRVLLIEAGGETVSSNARDPFGDVHYSHDVHQGTAEGRVRALGGSSLVWGGQLLPLPNDPPHPHAAIELDKDSLSFAAEASQQSSWPLSAHDLASYIDDAERLLGVDASGYEADEFFTTAQGHAQPNARDRPPLPKLIAQLHGPGAGFDARLSKFAAFRRRNLADSLGVRLRRHRTAAVLLHATATLIQRSEAGDSIAHITLRTPAGATLRIRADHFVLAAGTVETCRLLLASQIGNDHDLLGRGIHDHLTVTAATAKGAARERLLCELRPWVRPGGTLHSFKLEASAAMRRRLGLTPAMAHLVIEEPEDSGVGVLRHFLRGRQTGAASSTLRQTLPRLPEALSEAFKLWSAAAGDHRRYVSDRATVCLRLNVAQEVSPENRITLDARLDANGMPIVVIDWSARPPERLTLRRFGRELKAQLAAAGISEGLAWEHALLEDHGAPFPSLDDARHAMGGAPMGDDPRTSVVSPDLRVHGIRNLWIASPAMFPDGQAQLPGLTLMALCLRLAERLKHELKGRPDAVSSTEHA